MKIQEINQNLTLLNSFIGEKQLLDQIESGSVDEQYQNLTTEQIQEFKQRVQEKQEYLTQVEIIDENCNLLQDIDSILGTRNELAQYYNTVQQRYMQLTNPDEEYELNQLQELLRTLVADEAQTALLKDFDPNATPSDPAVQQLIDSKLNSLGLNVAELKAKQPKLYEMIQLIFPVNAQRIVNSQNPNELYQRTCNEL